MDPADYFPRLENPERRYKVNFSSPKSWKDFSSQLVKNRKTKHTTQAELAIYLEVGQSMISRWENGSQIPSDEIMSKWLDFFEIIKIYGEDTHDYLISKTKRFRESLQMNSSSEKFIQIPEYSVQASAGYGSYVNLEEIIEYHDIPKKFLPDHFKGNPAVIEVKGDSMYPTIGAGDHIIVALNSSSSEDGIYLIRIENSIHVKRIQHELGSIRIISDNPIYREMNMTREESENFQILGKIIVAINKYF